MMPQSNGSVDAEYAPIERSSKESAASASFGLRDPVEEVVKAGCPDR